MAGMSATIIASAVSGRQRCRDTCEASIWETVIGEPQVRAGCQPAAPEAPHGVVAHAGGGQSCRLGTKKASPFAARPASSVSSAAACSRHAPPLWSPGRHPRRRRLAFGADAGHHLRSRSSLTTCSSPTPTTRAPSAADAGGRGRCAAQTLTAAGSATSLSRRRNTPVHAVPGRRSGGGVAHCRQVGQATISRGCQSTCRSHRRRRQALAKGWVRWRQILSRRSGKLVAPRCRC